MAITKSAKRAIRQNKRRRAINLLHLNNLKKAIKETRSLVAKKDTDGAKKMLPKVYQALDKAAKAGVIKKNTASRKKSRIAKLVDKN